MNPPADIVAWLSSQGLAELTPQFEANAITPDVLSDINENDLKAMGINAIGHRKKLLAAIAALKAPAPVAVQVPAPVPVAEAVIAAAEVPMAVLVPNSMPVLAPAPLAMAVPVPVPGASRPESPSTPAPAVSLPPPTSGTAPSLPQPGAQARQPSSKPQPPPRPQPTAEVMEETLPPAPAPSSGPPPKRKGFSASFLAVSIALHVVLGLGAGYWVVQQINAKRKLQFASGPPTVSPSKRALEHKVSLQKKKNAGGAPAQARRIAVTGLAANITLPEMPSMPNSSTQIVAGRMSGMGGAGFGTGMGFGNGSGMGVGGMGKGGLGLTMFGARSGGGLPGTFYDLKQTSSKKPSGVTAETYNGVVRSWVASGLKEGTVDKYFRAPAKLYATQFMLPQMPADEAPKAYGVEKDVKPAQWVAHYKGKVSPPASGTYQFVGTADDTLIVRFDGKLVLDGSWFPVSGLQPEGIEPRGNYGGHPRKGYVKGEPIKVTAGQWYDIDVVIGEQPGGRFFACLCIMEKGKNAMPLFRLSPGKLPKTDNPPAFDENGPIWKAIGGSSSPLDMLKR